MKERLYESSSCYENVNVGVKPFIRAILLNVGVGVKPFEKANVFCSREQLYESSSCYDNVNVDVKPFETI